MHPVLQTLQTKGGEAILGWIGKKERQIFIADYEDVRLEGPACRPRQFPEIDHLECYFPVDAGQPEGSVGCGPFAG